ncbi:UNVERIFIED_ORG: murein DD-endopeptidase MepM/ murein hydrolase activator NlpD [Rhizobium esperanzae]
MNIGRLIVGSLGCFIAATVAAHAQELKYFAPGDVLPNKSLGIADRRVDFPGWRFPMNVGSTTGFHAYIGTQLSKYHGLDWSNDPRLFAYPSRDNQCEPREWNVTACPSGNGHQGVDIRANSNADNTWEVVAVEDGVVVSVTSNTTVSVRNGSHTVRYLHMHPQSIELAGIKAGVVVRQGQVIGKVSCFMSGSCSTSRHLHFDAYSGTAANGDFYHVYPSLIAAYRKAWKIPDGVVGGELAPDSEREVGSGASQSTGSGAVAGDGCASSGLGMILPNIDANTFDSIWIHNCSRVGFVVGPGDRRAFVYQRPRQGIQDLVASEPILFTGTLDQGGLQGQATQYSSHCGSQHFNVAGNQTQSGDDKTITLTGTRSRRDINCAVTGSVAETLKFTFLEKPTAVGSSEPHIVPSDRTTLSEITRNFLAITFYPSNDGNIVILPYFKSFPGILAEGGRLDSQGGLIPALSTDEGGVALSWTWIKRRAQFVKDTNFTPRLVAHSMAGVDPTRCTDELNAFGAAVGDAAQDVEAANAADEAQSECNRVKEYLRGYIGYSGGRNFAYEYFGRQVQIDEKLDMSNAEIRWNWMRTMYSHESGRAPVIDRLAFDRGIAFGDDYIAFFYGQEGTRLKDVAYYSEPCNFHQPKCVHGSTVGGEQDKLDVDKLAAEIGELASKLNAIEARLRAVPTSVTAAGIVGGVQ